MYFFVQVNVFLPLKFDAFEDGFSGQLWRVRAKSPITASLSGPTNNREAPNIHLNCLQTSKLGRRNVRKTHKETGETWKAVSARERIKENMDLPQILWWPDFTNTTENTLKILVGSIKQCQLKKIEKGKGNTRYESKHFLNQKLQNAYLDLWAIMSG